jgi:hypothetical protein
MAKFLWDCPLCGKGVNCPKCHLIIEHQMREDQVAEWTKKGKWVKVSD